MKLSWMIIGRSRLFLQSLERAGRQDACAPICSAINGSVKMPRALVFVRGKKNKMNRRKLTIIAGAVIIIGLLLLAYAYFIEPRRLVVTREEIAIKDWNPAFENLKIAMIGDIHGGSNHVTEEKIREVVRLTNAQEPDIITLLGDYVSEYDTSPIKLKMPLETVVENLKGLKARYGVFVVLGNHDSTYGDEKVAAAFRGIGYTVLQNQVASIESNGAKLRLLGIVDQLKIDSWGGFSNKLKAILAQGDQSGDIIALEHSPDVLPVIAGDFSISPKFKLFLAAHTHGGQVWLPVLGRPIIPSGYGQKYAYGHVKDNNVDMFVTAGIGTSILPVRFLVPPEIMLLTVNSEK